MGCCVKQIPGSVHTHFALQEECTAGWLKENSVAGLGKSCPGGALVVPMMVLAFVKQETLTAAVRNLRRGCVDDFIAHIARLMKSMEHLRDINHKMMVGDIPDPSTTARTDESQPVRSQLYRNGRQPPAGV
jgi:hypothetical protein